MWNHNILIIAAVWRESATNLKIRPEVTTLQLPDWGGFSTGKPQQPKCSVITIIFVFQAPSILDK